MVLAILVGGLVLGQISAFAPDYVKAKVAAARLFKIFDRRSFIDSSSEDGLKPVRVFSFSESCGKVGQCLYTRPDNYSPTYEATCSSSLRLGEMALSVENSLLAITSAQIILLNQFGTHKELIALKQIVHVMSRDHN